jgi:hypothetical protein
VRFADARHDGQCRTESGTRADVALCREGTTFDGKGRRGPINAEYRGEDAPVLCRTLREDRR